MFRFGLNVSPKYLRYLDRLGADPGFSLGGGGAKDYVHARTSCARSPKSLTAGVQGPLKDPGGIIPSQTQYAVKVKRHRPSVVVDPRNVVYAL